MDSLFHNISAWSKPSLGINASQCRAGQANDLLRSLDEAPLSFSLLYKELIGLIIPGVLGLIVPRAEKGVAQIGLVLCQKRSVKRTQGSGLMDRSLVLLGPATGEV